MLPLPPENPRKHPFRCEVGGCNKTTREGKPWCPKHVVAFSAYAATVHKNAKREMAREERRARAGSKVSTREPGVRRARTLTCSMCSAEFKTDNARRKTCGRKCLLAAKAKGIGRVGRRITDEVTQCCRGCGGEFRTRRQAAYCSATCKAAVRLLGRGKANRVAS